MRIEAISVICICFVLAFGADIFAQNSENVEQIVRIYSQWDAVNDVVVVDGLAYVAAGRTGLVIVDASDPQEPELVGYWDGNPGSAQSVVVSGDFAYLADYRSGLRIVSIADPENPYETGYYDTPDRAYDVAVSGDYIYIADGSAGLRVISVDSLGYPEEVGYVDTPGRANGVAVSGDFAYVADDYNGGLRVISIADPEDPEEVGYYDTGGYAMDVAVSGDLAFVANASTGLHVISIADPEHPEEVGHFDTPGSARSVAISGEYAYIADVNRGLRVVSLTDPENPQYEGFYDTVGFAYSVALSEDGLIYVADVSNLGIYRFTPVEFIESPWGDVTLTTSFCNVIFDEATYNGEALVDGDWIGVFTEDGLCAGAFQIVENGDIGLTAWGDNALTDEMDGFVDDEAMSFKIWIAVDDAGFDAEITEIRRGEAVWNEDALLICSIDATSDDIPLDMEEPPNRFYLFPAYPNPFNSSTTIRYSLPSVAMISLQLYNISGRQVSMLEDGFRKAGKHEYTLNAGELSAGLYFVRFAAGEHVQTQKVILVR